MVNKIPQIIFFFLYIYFNSNSYYCTGINDLGLKTEHTTQHIGISLVSPIVIVLIYLFIYLIMLFVVSLLFIIIIIIMSFFVQLPSTSFIIWYLIILFLPATGGLFYFLFLLYLLRLKPEFIGSFLFYIDHISVFFSIIIVFYIFGLILRKIYFTIYTNKDMSTLGIVFWSLLYNIVKRDLKTIFSNFFKGNKIEFEHLGSLSVLDEFFITNIRNISFKRVLYNLRRVIRDLCLIILLTIIFISFFFIVTAILVFGF